MGLLDFVHGTAHAETMNRVSASFEADRQHDLRRGWIEITNDLHARIATLEKEGIQERIEHNKTISEKNADVGLTNMIIDEVERAIAKHGDKIDEKEFRLSRRISGDLRMKVREKLTNLSAYKGPHKGDKMDYGREAADGNLDMAMRLAKGEKIEPPTKVSKYAQKGQPTK